MRIISFLKNIGIGFLTSKLAVRIVRSFYTTYIPFFGLKININNQFITDREVINLFWGIYEKAEVRMSRKYYSKGMTVVEFGSSIGVISALLGKMKGPDVHQYCIEANESLIPTLKANLEINAIENYTIIQKAIGPKGVSSVFLDLSSSNLNSKISNDSTGQVVETLDLIEFIAEESLRDFFLICDIEGAEIFFINEQIEFLVHCKTAVIELHNISFEGKYYSRELLNELIQSRSNLRLLEKYRHVYVYQRK